VLGQAVRDLSGGEEQVLGPAAGLDLGPGDRGGDGGELAGAQRVGRDGGLGAVVLAPVDEHLAGAQRLGHAGDGMTGLLAFESFGVGLGPVAGLLGGHPGNPRVQLQALAA
jgi:hypothetical protein